jgi:hypothetical protein
MIKHISAFGIAHSVDFSKSDSVLHVPLNIVRQIAPRTTDSPRLLKLAGKIDRKKKRYR